MRLRDRAIHDLGDLPSRRAVPGPERAVRVARDDAVVICRLHVIIEGRPAGHVCEVRASTEVDSPILSEHYYLGQLPPRHAAARSERAVRIARNDLVRVSRLHISVESAPRSYV